MSSRSHEDIFSTKKQRKKICSIARYATIEVVWAVAIPGDYIEGGRTGKAFTNLLP
jgi:hypothetical protein